MKLQVVKEELELGFRPEIARGEDAEAAQAQLSATLSSKDLSLAVAVLVKSFSPEDASVGIDVDNGNGSGRAGASGTFEARANAAAARLEGFSVVFVKELRSRFLRVGDTAGGVSGEEDITAANGATGSVFFVREVRARARVRVRAYRVVGGVVIDSPVDSPGVVGVVVLAGGILLSRRSVFAASTAVLKAQS